MKKILVLVLAISLLTSCSYTQNSNYVLSGTIESTQNEINSEISGKLINFNFNEGDKVKANDIICELDNTVASLQVKLAQDTFNQVQARYNEVLKGSRPESIRQAEANYNQALARLQDLINGTRTEQIRQIEAQIAQTNSSIQYHENNYEYRKNNYENIKKLFEEKSASQQQVDDAKSLLDQAYNQLQSSRKQLDSQQAQLDLLKSGNTSETIQQARAQAEAAKAQLDLLRSGNTQETIAQAKAQLDQANTQIAIAKTNYEKIKIISPVSGILSLKNVDVGEMVFPGTNVATVVNPSDLWVKVYVPQKQIHKVSLNKKVQVISSAISKTDINGQIIYISPKAEFTPKNTETKEGKENQVFEVKVKVLDNIDKLKPGMTVDVVI